MRKSELTRRNFIQKLAIFGGATVAGGALLTACGGGEESSEGGDSGGGDSALACNDVSGLTEAEQTTRSALNYVDASLDDGEELPQLLPVRGWRRRWLRNLQGLARSRTSRR